MINAMTQVRGIPAHIVLPQGTPSCKVEAVTGYGGRYGAEPDYEQHARWRQWLGM